MSLTEPLISGKGNDSPSVSWPSWHETFLCFLIWGIYSFKDVSGYVIWRHSLCEWSGERGRNKYCMTIIATAYLKVFSKKCEANKDTEVDPHPKGSTVTSQ